MNMSDIKEAFPSLTKEDRHSLASIFEGDIPLSTYELEDYEERFPITCKWLRQCYYWAEEKEIQLSMISEIIGGFGVEAIFTDWDRVEPALSYVNMGDTYDTTIAYDHQEDEWILTSYGDWVEAYESETGETIP